jgi:protein transport protein SEC31
MVQLKQITRNAIFAWSPAKGKPLIVSGTIAGAVDASFSQDSELEIWDLGLDNTDNSSFELQPTAKITTERKYIHLVEWFANLSGFIALHGDTSRLINHAV